MSEGGNGVDEREKEMILEDTTARGFTVESWLDHPDNGTTAMFVGRFVAIEDDEDEGIYSGDEGELSACVVGAAQYGNERVSYSLKLEGRDETEVDPENVDLR